MNKKIYESTRYQNIYRHIKNKNYVITINNPKTTISTDENDNKIYDIKKAISIRDNPTTKKNKKIEQKNKDNFDDLWEQYIYDCTYIKKLEYNTIKRKNKDYNCHLKGKINISIHKADKFFWSNFIDKLNTTNKQKNHILKQLNAFYNWLVEEEKVVYNPLKKINKYDTEDKEMLYWSQDEIKRFFETINQKINVDDGNIKEKRDAYLVKMLTIFGFALGDRVGETRALTWDCIDYENNTLHIKHSIEYDPQKYKSRTYYTKKDDTLKSIAANFNVDLETLKKVNNNVKLELQENQKIIIPRSYLKGTKNEWSTNYVEISPKLCNEIENYKNFLINELGLDLNPMIFWNYDFNQPYSDTTLRKKFHKYCQLAHVTKIRMYDLRHTFVATMMTEGVELYNIQRLVRHKSNRTTTDKYGHLSIATKKIVSKITDNYY